MLTWDEEVKPSSPKNLDSGLPHNRKAEPAPQLAAVAQFAPAHQSNTPRTATPVAATSATAHRRVNAADKRIINGQTDVNQLVPFK